MRLKLLINLIGEKTMIRCNLAILLAERNLKLTKVAKDTNISRTTLTYLSYNYSKGIQYDTLNTLCQYLHVTPNELISYVPTDIHIITVHRDQDLLDIALNITHNGITKQCNLCGHVYAYLDESLKSKNSFPELLDIVIGLWDPIDDTDIERENDFIISAFHSLPVSFRSDIEDQLINEIIQTFEDEYPGTDTTPTVSFDWEPPLIQNHSN